MTTETMTPPTPSYKVGDKFASKTCGVVWEIVGVKIISKNGWSQLAEAMEETLVVQYEFAAEQMLNTKITEYDIDLRKWNLIK